MNKQELIDKLNELKVYGYDSTLIKREVLDLVEQLHEPKKVVLPKDAAEWFEFSKHMNLLELLSDLYEHYSNDEMCIGKFVKEYCTSVDEACRKIARAYLDGYEVEKEKLYTVVLPNAKTMSDSSHKSFLMRTETGKVILKNGNFNVKDHTKLTEEEIKSLDERYMAFAQEVAE